MEPTRPVLATADPHLRADVERLAAAAGTSPRVVADPVALLHSWPTAPMVVLGADLLAGLRAHRPERRPDVAVVCAGEATERVFREALEVGASTVVELPAGAEALGMLLGELADLGDDPTPGRVVGVLAGAGGAGATTLAAALGQVAAEDGPCLVVDADPCGPGLDRVLGLDEVEGIGWATLAPSHGRLSARDLRCAVPRRDDLGVLAFRSSGAAPDPALVREVLAAARRGHRHVVVDLPRHLPDAGGWTSRCDLVVVVVPDSVAGVAAAARTCATLPDGGRVGLVLRGRRLDPRAVAEATGHPVLTTMRAQRGLDEAVDLGLGPLRSRRGPLARAAAAVLAAVGSDVVEAA